jgi:DNA-binding NarL/FixJ family response regulator
VTDDIALLGGGGANDITGGDGADTLVGGPAVIRAVHAERPGVRFLALSVSEAPDDAIAIIRAGARGYVTKSIDPAELIDAIHRVADGDAVLSPLLSVVATRAGRASA